MADPKDGSNIQFYNKEQVMMCARDLIQRQIRNPTSLKGIKLPFGLEIRGGYEHMMFFVYYYGRQVGTVDMDFFGITYLM